MLTATPLSLQEISDRTEILEMRTRYYYAVNDGDWLASRGLFTPDAVVNVTVTSGVCGGLEDHVTYLI